MGRQEDAAEFLCCIVDGMHEEMAAVLSLNNSIANTDGVHDGYTNREGIEVEKTQDEEDSSKQVELKRKLVSIHRICCPLMPGISNGEVTNCLQSKIVKTPITNIFYGKLRSSLYKSSSKGSANIEPFFTLQLDVQSAKVKSVQDALHGLVSIEHVAGYSSNNIKGDWFKKLSLEELPPVLILHLKSFVFNYKSGSQKLVKKVNFSVDLEITKDLLPPNTRNKLDIQQRIYKLFAVVYHYGRETTCGHYTTTVFHKGINGWIDIDDSNVKTVHVSQVLKYMPPRVPYLLYYRCQK